MSLKAAIEQLAAEVELFRQGTPAQPKEGSADWFLLRAKALSLSSLKRAEQLTLGGNPPAAERFFTSCSRTFKASEDADAD